MRLAEAVSSRALLLRELAAVLHQETAAKQVMILEPDEERKQRIVVAHGMKAKTLTNSRQSFLQAMTMTPAALRQTAQPETYRAEVHQLSAGDAADVTGGRRRDFAGMSLDPLLRVVELGMDVCALRSRGVSEHGSEQQDGATSSGLMPGFIHSSPAMTRLVEEVNKIRSSDVTVLVTGESGTGKELVARAIHALSARRDKIFVPFNCTAVPKELSESYLFGHRRGAFTGAVNDSSGVIRFGCRRHALH
jgi:transcriptional regulator with PAS, ATPase and Fis domain